MKKIIALALIVSTLTMLSACTPAETDSPQTSSTETTSVSQDTSSENNAGTKAPDTEQSPAKQLIAFMKETVTADESMSPEKICEAALNDTNLFAEETGVFEFAPMYVPVEPGLLTGFGNDPIEGFKAGSMITPMIGAIPFIAYVFELEDETDVDVFMKQLTDHCDLRWNICTEADEAVVDHVGNTVFFTMSKIDFDAE